MSSKQKVAKIEKVVENDNGIYQEYFGHVDHYSSTYGDRVIVLMQVGAFFEVYGIKDEYNKVLRSKIEEFAEVCQLNVSEKKISYGGGQIVMAGFRDYTLDKYLAKITDAGYTTTVFVQEKQMVGNKEKIVRILKNIYSAGTYISCDTDSLPKITNHIMCIWMETYKGTSNQPQIVYGVSVVNIFTGKTSMFQYETAFYMNMTTFDELERYVSIFSPSEVIILSPFEESKVKTIIQFVGICSPSIHIYSIGEPTQANPKSTITTKITNCMNQRYIKEIISTMFGDEVYDICSEFQIHTMATQSFCYLLNYIQEHNPDLVRKIAIPEFNNTSTRMILANHTLSQLNIIEDATVDSSKSGHLSCVLSFLNKCNTAMGKRRFQYQLLNPTFDEEWLQSEYSMIHLIMQHYHFVDGFRKQLCQIKDIEKICRQLLMKRVYPSSIYQLFHSVGCIQQINMCLAELPDLCKYLCIDFYEIGEPSAFEYIQEISTKVLDFLNKHLVMDICKQTASITMFGENIIRPGISSKLDEIIQKYNTHQEQFKQIQQYLNGLMQTYEKSADTDYIKIHETEKSGVCLHITNKRSLVLYTALSSQPESVEIANGVRLNTKDVKFVKASASTVEIQFPLLHTLCKDLLIGKEMMNQVIMETYMTILTKLDIELYKELENLASYVSKIDVLINKTYIAKQYKYCCPTISNDAADGKSFVDARELRHCLIEHIQQNEIYVTNDVVLGKDRQDGILLYGTNAVGKTSLIRSLGIAIIMAQSGMFVPCSQFIFKPYTAIFSRILGNDNLFKGLSTFAVEMTELRIILKMADQNSLILGDELCSGTETESALSIFTAGLMNLHQKQSSFIFATHFHEIVEYEEIQNLENLTLKHMAVHYDMERDCLIYDRKMQNGSGPRTYGLEVCKSLYLDSQFLELSYSIRDKYFPNSKGLLSMNKTRYNASKIRGLCEVCSTQIGEETHHLSPQKDADEDGFIGTFHKNHKANLLTVCEKCHDKLHSASVAADQTTKNNTVPMRKKTTRGYRVI